MAQIEWLEQTDNGRVVQREFTVHGAERAVPGVLWQPSGAPSGTPLICLGHGASGDRHQPPSSHLVRNLVGNEGFSAVAIDGPVHGRRAKGDAGRGAFSEEWARPGSVDDMIADWKAAIDAVQASTSVGNSPLGYWGLSMGTIFGAPLVAAEPRIQVAVLGLMGIAGPSGYRTVLAQTAPKIACPILFLQQLEDELFRREQCLELFDAIGSPDKRLHANPGLHIQVPLEELRFSIEFLSRHLKGDGARRASGATATA